MAVTRGNAMTTPTVLARAALACALSTVPALAAAEIVIVPLRGFEEVPSISSPARGLFRAFVNRHTGVIAYQLSYQNLQGDVSQAHLHFGQRGVNGGISVFLCQTAASPDPTGLAPTCPQSGSVSGQLQAANVIGPSGQGIAAGEFEELLAAIRAGAVYVNVHSSTWPGGEIRGQTHGFGFFRHDGH
jgi:hypothetical protein